MSSGIFRTYRNLVVLGLRQRSCRNLIYVYALHIRACIVIRCRVSLQRLGSRSPRGHLAQENSARSHFEVAWPGKTRPEVTSKSLGSRKLGSKSLGFPFLARYQIKSFSFEEARWPDDMYMSVPISIISSPAYPQIRNEMSFGLEVGGPMHIYTHHYAQ